MRDPLPLTRLTRAEQEKLDHLFSYHPPARAGQFEAYNAIRAAGRLLAEAVMLNAPECADQSAALRKVREAVMTANAAVALHPKRFHD